ncbi:ferritin-like domain-containing protein [Longispora albida]|uniref:ferritin-like domain-containing protein n=1 Tax=Longispora albida TaxID=203523 RepID=UPI00036C3C69|nr:ferritin-like domain-containing protein [Longispora albida]
MSANEQLAAALVAEHAAIFGYGTLGSRLDGAVLEAARQADAAHRERRDALTTRLATAKATAPPSESAYALPFPVTDRASALKLAVQLEERTAQAWRAVLPVSTGDERKLALDALLDASARAARWRRAAGVTPASVAFPGKP